MTNFDALFNALRFSHQRTGGKAKVLVALSGGADSLALLSALSELQIELGLQLTCCHINHGLREASFKEEEAVIAQATALDVPLTIRRVEVNKQGNLENAAREARYQALVDAAHQQGAELIALAHHAQDQAETVLMHLIRGAGAEGLSGMQEYRPPFWRPLLSISKIVLLDYLRFKGLSWVEDESNQDETFQRNFLRLKVFPLLESLHKGTSLRMAKSSQILCDEQKDWEIRVSNWLSKNAKASAPFYFVLLAPLRKETLAMQRRILRKVCNQAGIEMDFDQTESLVDFVSNPVAKSMNLPGKASAFLSQQRLHILPDAVKSMKVPWSQPRVADVMDGYGNGTTTQQVDKAAVAGAIMRQAEPEDMIQPFGMDGHQPLKKYLSAKGIDPPFRQHWPVYAKGNEVFWVPGCGISQKAAVSCETLETLNLSMVDQLPHTIFGTEEKHNVESVFEQ